MYEYYLSLLREPPYYKRVLDKLCIDTENVFPWIYSKATKNRIAGWKLHISATPQNFVELLKQVLPLLKDYNVPFKVISGPRKLAALNIGFFGAIQVGKCITIYPDSTNEAIMLAKKLLEITKSFSGPDILTDIKLGNILFARYGAIKPHIVRDYNGNEVPLIKPLTGKGKVPDEYHIPYLVEHRLNPFRSFLQSNIKNSDFSSHYIIEKVLKADIRGSAFKVTEIKSHKRYAIREYRYCVDADKQDEFGFKKLENQYYIYNILKANHINVTPKLYHIFNANGNKYLVREWIDGESIASQIGMPWNRLNIQQKIKKIDTALKILKRVSTLHSLNIVHRDLTPNNLLISKDGRVFIIDLELAFYTKSKKPPIIGGTVFFLPQEKGLAISKKSDIYTLGCTLISYMGGLNIRHLVYLKSSIERRNLLKFVFGESTNLADPLLSCLDRSPYKRPSISELSYALLKERRMLKHGIRPSAKNLSTSDYKIRAPKLIKDFMNIRKMTNTLLNYELLDKFKRYDISKLPDDLDIYNSYTGISGLIYLASQIYRIFPKSNIDKDYIANLINIILSKKGFLTGYKGLYGGSGGISVVLAEALASGLYKPNKDAEDFINRSFLIDDNLYSPEIFFGAAGQGLAALECGKILHNNKILNYSKKYVKYLIEIQAKDGSWATPQSLFKNKEIIYYGFAHGIAGITYFLLEYYRTFPEANNAKLAAERAIAFLLENKLETKGHSIWNWGFSSEDKTIFKWWCHGAPGISLIFLKEFEISRDKKYLYYFNRTLQNYSNTGFSNVNICHGMSGLGEIYLAGYRSTKKEYLYERAGKIFKTFIAIANTIKDAPTPWLSSDLDAPSSSLMLGSSGIIYFILDYLTGGKLGFPLL